jgi:RNA polymerase sigma-70 factor (ECF subfamily)
MLISTFRSIFLAVLFGFAASAISDAQDVTLETAAPVVIRSEPEAGSESTDASTVTEIKVTFSKTMKDQSWSWGRVSPDSFPEIVKDRLPRFENDGRTAVLPVKLEKNKTYAVWVNSDSLKNFKDSDGRSALPYLIVFRTKP